MNLELALKQVYVLGSGRLFAEYPVAVKKIDDKKWSIYVLGADHEVKIGLKGAAFTIMDERNNQLSSNGRHPEDNWEWYNIKPGIKYEITIK